MRGVGALIYIFFLIMAILFKNANHKAKGDSKSPAKPASTAQKARTTPAQSRTNTASARTTVHHKDEDCDYGDENHAYSHDAKQRIEQLDSFLKSGIIDKEEYKVLLNRYRQYKD